MIMQLIGCNIICYQKCDTKIIIYTNELKTMVKFQKNVTR
jgi:hypothetical protein